MQPGVARHGIEEWKPRKTGQSNTDRVSTNLIVYSILG